MTEKDIRQIPKYIMDEIYRRDLKIEPWQTSTVRYYAYLTVWEKELVKVTVAVATLQNKHWVCKQVAVHGVHSKLCFVKDMEYNYFGFGFRVGWYAEELQTQQKQFEDGRWHTADKKYYDPYAPLINCSVVGKFPEYKYSAYQFYKGRDIISYLRIYEQYPQTEYLLKLGLGAYAENRSFLKKLVKEKAFCQWVIRSRKELALPYGNAYNITTITQAYKTGLPLKEVAHFLFRKKQFERESSMAPIRELIKGWELKKYFDYTEKHNISGELWICVLPRNSLRAWKGCTNGGYCICRCHLNCFLPLFSSEINLPVSPIVQRLLPVLPLAKRNKNIKLWICGNERAFSDISSRANNCGERPLLHLQVPHGFLALLFGVRLRCCQSMYFLLYIKAGMRFPSRSSRSKKKSSYSRSRSCVRK